MRKISILSFLFLLVVIQTQIRQIPIGGIIRTDFPILTFADCYEGTVNVDISKGD